MERIDKSEKIVKENPELFLSFLKSIFPLFHNSNLFFRDIQYGLKRYLEKKNVNLSVSESEKAALGISEFYESEGILVRVNNNTWKVNFPEFVTKVPGDPL